MFSNLAIDVALGLIFIYLLYSLFASILQEMIARAFNLRARILTKGLRRMLEDDDHRDDLGFFGKFTFFNFFYELGWSVVHFFSPFRNAPLLKKFYASPSIHYLGENSAAARPAYISPQVFSQTVVHLLRNNTQPQENDAAVIATSLADNPLHIAPETLSHLRNLFEDAGRDVKQFRIYLEAWFNETMARATGWYRKHTQTWLLVIGMFMAGIFNVDTIAIARILMKDKTVRQEMVQLASSQAPAFMGITDTLARKNMYFRDKDSAFRRADTSLRVFVADTSLIGVYAMLRRDAGDARNVLGIHREFSPQHPYGLVHPLQQKGWLVLGGWFMTAMALSLGAPFWFDLLGRVVKFRTTAPDNTRAG